MRGGWKGGHSRFGYCKNISFCTVSQAFRLSHSDQNCLLCLKGVARRVRTC